MQNPDWPRVTAMEFFFSKHRIRSLGYQLIIMRSLAVPSRNFLQLSSVLGPSLSQVGPGLGLLGLGLGLGLGDFVSVRSGDRTR